MTAPRQDEMTVHLTVDDARTVRAAGIKFARTFSGAYSEDFALALIEQERMIQRAVTKAGYTVRQSEFVAREFTAAATAEWQRVMDAGNTMWGTA